MIDLSGVYCGAFFRGGMIRSENTVFIKECWKENNDDKFKKKETEENGITLDEKVTSLSLFIDTFTRFRTMLNLLLPTKEEFFSFILRNRGVSNLMLHLLLTDITDVKTKIFRK